MTTKSSQRTGQAGGSNRRLRRPAKHGERGFSAVLLAVCLVVMIGMLGLAVDAGRMFICKSELQAFVDASAMAAVSHMDGTQSGITAANSIATAGPLGATKPNGYNFGTTAIGTVTNTYATSFTGAYDGYGTASSPATNTYRFLRVTASANVPLTFLPVLPGISTTASLNAMATAGQNPASSLSGNMLPFAPDAHNQADTVNFGLTVGSSYTLKWDNGNTTTCAGDSGFTPPGQPPSEHGFVNIGEGNSNSNVRDAIRWGGYPNANSTPDKVATGDDLSGVPGNRGSSIFDALKDRAEQDTDDTSTTYAAYKSNGGGNGRRIVTVAIAGTWGGNGSNAHTSVLGFANFFLNTTYSGTSGPICATYIGPGNLGGYGSGGSDSTKVYSNMLYQ